MTPQTSHVRGLVDELLALDYPGVTVLVLFADYRQRGQLAQALAKEAGLHGVKAQAFSVQEEAMEKMPLLSADRGDAALVLLDAGDTERWGRWLEASREKLPDWVRFLVVMVAPDALPALAKEAPALMSWAKGRIIENLEQDEEVSGAEVSAEFAEMRRQTGFTPEQFVQAWRDGRLADTHRNSAWLNLAEAAIAAGEGET